MNVVYRPTFPDAPSNPARCNRATGLIEINLAVWNTLTPLQRKYWLHHEIGHIKLQTGNEILADAYAFDAVAGSEPYSLTQIRNTISNVAMYDRYTRLKANAWDSIYLSAARGNKFAQNMIDNKNTLSDIANKSIVTKPIYEEFNSDIGTVKTIPSNELIFIQSSTDPNSNVIVLETQEEQFLTDSPIVDELPSDNAKEDHDDIFLGEDNQSSTPPKGPQKAIDFSYTTPAEEIARANAIANSEAMTMRTIIIGIMVLVVIILALVALKRK